MIRVKQLVEQLIYLSRNEPVMVKEFFLAFFSLLVAFGLRLSGEQVAALVTFLTLFLGLVARSCVTPCSKLGEGEGSDGGEEDGAES